MQLKHKKSTFTKRICSRCKKQTLIRYGFRKCEDCLDDVGFYWRRSEGTRGWLSVDPMDVWEMEKNSIVRNLEYPEKGKV